MKREILFRGKSVSHGGWEYGDLITSCGSVFIGNTVGNSPDDWCKVIPETVGQFTGKTDINGNKIFEGDILEIESASGYHFLKAVVCWDERQAKFFDKNDNMDFISGFYWAKEWKIIGNIHDNPTLI